MLTSVAKRLTVIAAQEGRFELLRVAYGIEEIDGRRVVKVDYMPQGPVIAWQVFAVDQVSGTITAPVGMGVTFGNDYADRDREPSKIAFVWYDRESGHFHAVWGSGAEGDGWDVVCKVALEERAGGDLRDEREGLEWVFPQPPNWD